jgi:glycosyltransferase involved in cell wall biosynthesis
MSGFLGRGVARCAGVTHIIHTVHGYSFNEPGSAFKKKLYFLIEKLMARFTDLFICINQADTDLTKNQFKKPVWYIPNGIELKKPDPSRLEQMNNLLKAKKRIGSVANFYRTKGLLPFLELFHEIVKHDSEIHWYVVGEGPLKTTFQNRVQQLHLGEHVHVLGYQENIIEFMHCLDLLVIPSISEAQSLVLLEAMSQKTLTCVTAVGGMKEIIQSGVNGVILNTTQDVLLALNLSPEQKKRLTEKAYQDFLEKFTIEKMLSMTEKAYESIIRS